MKSSAITLIGQYIKDLSFENPMAPNLPSQNKNPTVDLNINTTYLDLKNNNHEIWTFYSDLNWFWLINLNNRYQNRRRARREYRAPGSLSDERSICAPSSGASVVGLAWEHLQEAACVVSGAQRWDWEFEIVILICEYECEWLRRKLKFRIELQLRLLKLQTQFQVSKTPKTLNS